MHRIFLIGQGMKPHADELKGRGHATRTFRSPESAMKHLNNADAIVFNRDLGDGMPELLRAAKNIPKVMVSSAHCTRKMGAYLREQFTYAMHEPSEKELAMFLERILKEHRQREKVEASASKARDYREELAFYLQMNRLLALSNNIHEVLVTVLRRARKLTGAEHWAVLLADKVTGELVCEKNSYKPSQQGGNGSKVHIMPGEGPAGWVARNLKPLLVADASRDRRLSKNTQSLCACKPRTIICAPIISSTQFLGVLELINKKDGSPFTEDELAILVGLTEQAAMSVERITLQLRLEELVVTDDLTNLFNTRYLNRSVETEIQRSRRYGTSISVIFMDIDHFKNVNDTHGHLVGSKLLVEMGQLLINELRNIDIVARYGGDEFVLVLPQTNLKNAMFTAERIRSAIANMVFLKSEGLNLTLTASFGVASYPESALTKEDLMRLADESMYRVKNHTRNGVYAII